MARLWIDFFITVVLCAPAQAAPVIGVSDGDTLSLMVNGRPARFRLADIDAPEKQQPFGDKSKLSLSQLCYRKEATYTLTGVDRYGRAVARVFCDGVDVRHAQVERGLAWVYTRYNQDPSLPALEASAKAARRGMWSAESAIPPWVFRQARKHKTRGACDAGEP